MKSKIINGNSFDELKKIEDNYFDSVVTDPPYGLGKEPNANKMLQAWVTDGYLEVKGSGFMGKDWDSFVPQPLFWKEVFRVLKPGGHIVAFFGTRTYDWGCMAIRLAGFEIRDGLQWIYGSGFPKSHNIGKAVDKLQGNEREVVGTSRAGSKERDGYKGDMAIMPFETKTIDLNVTKGNSTWDGWGTALKPAVEPIVLARKPIEKGLSIAENVLKWGVGAINIDECRVGKDLIKGQKAGQGFNNVKGFGVNTKLGNEEAREHTSEDVNGRFPANIILTHHVECEFKGLKKVKGQIDKPTNRTKFEGTWNDKNTGLRKYTNLSKEGYGDENGEETIEDWNCHENCPIRIMDEQSGESKSSGGRIGNKNGAYSAIGATGFTTNHEKGDGGFGDKGGASRFFYTAKASKSERNFGLEGFEEKQMAWSNQAKAELKRGNIEFADDVKMHNKVQTRLNIHPTVKPVKLMQYLARLITPPNGKVLDPFNGSGTTGIACSLENFEYIGIELSEDYCKISQARIDAWNEIYEYEDYKKIIETEEEEENSYEGKQFKLF